ncbi:MAG: aminoacyl--tRNA ligase-related protein, partial [Patescibacteria group bacterium]
MKQSHLFAKTIRNISDDVKSASHKLLLRGGFIFPVAAGIYALSPLGFRVFEKIKNIIRSDFDKFEVQEISMPIVHPARIWKQTGRFQEIGDELWKIKNREGEDFVLAMTHEEIVAHIAETVIKTYKDLPILVNQFQIKIRDELRARGGMLRAKEFLMQDAYSFDRNEKGMDESYEKFYESYKMIYKNLSLEVVSVEASGGVMGQGQSHEFMLISEVGEDKAVFCEKCGYKANIEVLVNAKNCQK